MPYAINLCLGADALDGVEAVLARLAASGVGEHDLITQYGACVTLLVVEDRMKPDAVARTVELRLPGIRAMRLALTAPCVIHATPRVLALRVAPAAPLLALHGALHSEFEEGEIHLHHRPAYWQPHLKLANLRGDQANVARLVATLGAAWRGRDGWFDRLEVVRTPPTETVWQARLQAEEPG